LKGKKSLSCDNQKIIVVMKKFSYQRADKVRSLVHREVANLLQKMNDPRTSFVTITHVEITKDLELAKIYYSVLNSERKLEVATMFKKASGFIRTYLADKLLLRRALEVRFIYDEFLEQSQRVINLLDKIKDESDK
jgi:ribosome-binding factor A